MKKTVTLLLSFVAFISADAIAQRRTREVPPVYTHVPCNTPGAREERPIDLRVQPDVAAPATDKMVKNEDRSTKQANRVGCVIEGPIRPR